MKSERKRLTGQLDKLCREIVRIRDDNKCQICSKTISGSNSQPCHVIAKGVGASWRRFDLLNIFLGCMHCHQWWHLNPTESSRWFAEKWPHRDTYLEKYRGGKISKISVCEMKELVVEYKQKLKELKEEVTKYGCKM